MHRFSHQMKSLIPKQLLHNIFFWSENIIIFIKLNLKKFIWLYQNRPKWNKLEAAKINIEVKSIRPLKLDFVFSVTRPRYENCAAFDKNPKKIIIYLNWSFPVFLINLRCFKSQENVWKGAKHALTCQNYYRSSSGSCTRSNIANNNFEHLLELEWRGKKYACSRMLVVNKQN